MRLSRMTGVHCPNLSPGSAQDPHVIALEPMYEASAVSVSLIVHLAWNHHLVGTTVQVLEC